MVSLREALAGVEVLAGVGRTLAAKTLEWDPIRPDVRSGLTASNKLRISFSENEEQEDASPLYQAALLNGMLEADPGLTQLSLAQKIGKSQQLVSLYMGINALPAKLVENTNALVKLGLRHFVQICRLKTPEDQINLALSASAKGWSATELQKRVDHLLGKIPKEAPLTSRSQEDPIADVWSSFTDAQKQVCEVVYKGPFQWQLKVRARTDNKQGAVPEIYKSVVEAAIKVQLGDFFRDLAQSLGIRRTGFFSATGAPHNLRGPKRQLPCRLRSV